MQGATIIIAAWNAEEVLEKSIDSARNQQGISEQIIVVDDASTDQTAQVAKANQDIDFFRLEQNSGPSAARNVALSNANKDWIAVLDSDDTMQPSRLSGMIDVATKAQADIVLGNFQRVDQDGTALDQPDFLHGASIDETKTLTVSDYLRDNLFDRGGRSTGYLKPLFQSKTINRLNLRYDESLRNSEDFHIILRAIILGAKVVVSRSPDYLYTVRPGSISFRVDSSKFSALLAADVAFQEEFAEQIDDNVRNLFKVRRENLISIMEGEIVMQCLKHRQYREALSNLMRRPKTALQVFRQLTESARKRLGLPV